VEDRLPGWGATIPNRQLLRPNYDQPSAVRRSAPLIEQLRQATVDRVTQRRVNVLNLGVAGYVALDGQRREPFRDGDIRTAGATNSRGTFRVLRRVAMARGRGEDPPQSPPAAT